MSKRKKVLWICMEWLRKVSTENFLRLIRVGKRIILLKDDKEVYRKHRNDCELTPKTPHNVLSNLLNCHAELMKRS